MDFQDPPKSEKVARNPNNANILKGGKVDPRSQLYQRSVAGREQLKDYLSRLSNSGKDEADVFMAGVKSLMNRGHGYVGAYLDSKNPGRRYEKNQAMAITDKVMTDEGIGEHPGARLTRPKVTDEEGNIDKEATKEARDKRKEANAGRGSGPQQAPGPSAKPVGQQRKEGKRESTGQAPEDSRRDPDIGKPETGPVSEWQNTLESRMKGEASTQDVLSAFQKQYQSKIKTTPKGGDKPAQPPASGGAQPPAAPGQPPTSEGQPPAQPPADGAQPPDEETETPGKPLADDVTVSSKFKELIEDNIKSNLPSTDKNALEGSIQEAIKILEDEYDVDPEAARAAIFRRFNNKLIGGRKIVFDPSSAPERPGQKESAPETGQQRDAEPAPTAAAPGGQETAGPEPTATPEANPGQQEAAAPTAPAPAPTARQPLPEEQLGRGGRPGGNKPSGFTPQIGKQAKGNIRQAVSKGLSPQEAVEQFINGNLFGQTAIETGSAATNPLEDSPPDQYERFRGDPAEKYKGAQEGGRELPTAGKGQEGQGSLLKKGTMEARGDFRKGAKPKPSRPAQPGPKSYEQTGLFGKDEFKDDQGGNPIPTESPEELAPSSALPESSRPSESPGQKTFLSRAKGKETQILPSAIQVPKPGQGVTDAESYTRQLRDAKIPSDKINQAVKEKFGTKPRGKARSKGPKVINSAEYQEFAQSVRSMMR